jgi:hypothetical protein
MALVPAFAREGEARFHVHQEIERDANATR